MRVIMRVGARFEPWACRYIIFEGLDEVWPYLLEERFGEACAATVGIDSLGRFEDRACLIVALRLRLPVKADASLPVPVDITVANPGAKSAFVRIRIQTVRPCGDRDMVPFTVVDDPFNPSYEPPVFAFTALVTTTCLNTLRIERPMKRLFDLFTSSCRASSFQR